MGKSYRSNSEYGRKWANKRRNHGGKKNRNKNIGNGGGMKNWADVGMEEE